MTKNTRLSFAVLSIGYVASLHLNIPVSGLFKILPLLVLFIAVTIYASPPKRHFLLVALFFSMCGDLLLNENQFVFGVAAFLLAQLSYAFLFVRDWQGMTKRLPISGFLLLYLGVVLYLLLPNLGSLLIPVMAYIFAIGFMGFAAIQSKLNAKYSVAGALVFILSDSLIAFEKFLLPIPYNDYWIMSSYYLAQWLLIEGFFKQDQT
ncbi:lysoplasmalogenase [Paraglaciecola sp.]|uniref:lysoplasmalogenase n=1 Tax=Paraglaciecola sp. TaxID=1920173 RepID=UPI003EF131E1